MRKQYLFNKCYFSTEYIEIAVLVVHIRRKMADFARSRQRHEIRHLAPDIHIIHARQTPVSILLVTGMTFSRDYRYSELERTLIRCCSYLFVIQKESQN